MRINPMRRECLWEMTVIASKWRGYRCEPTRYCHPVVRKADSSRRALWVRYQCETLAIVLNVPAKELPPIADRIDWPIPVMLSSVIMRVWQAVRFFQQSDGPGAN